MWGSCPVPSPRMRASSLGLARIVIELSTCPGIKSRVFPQPARSCAAAMSPSVGFLDEDEGGALDYGRARADEGDIDVLDLAFPGTSRRLKRSLDDVPETMDAPRTQASTEGV